MRIAIVTDSFFPGVGGTEKATHHLACALAELGHEVVVCAPHFRGEDDSVFPYKVLRCASIPVTHNDVMAFPNLSRKFQKQLEQFQPQILHCQSVSGMTSCAIKYGKRHNVPVIMTVHTKFRESFAQSIPLPFVVNMLVKDIVKKANSVQKVCTVSYNMAGELAKYGYKGETLVFRNGAVFPTVEDKEQTKIAAVQKYGLQKYDNVLLFVGRVTKVKNLQFTFDALKLVKEQLPNFVFLVVGRGSDEKYFKKYAEKCGLTDNVIFTGAITDKAELSSLYAAGELFLFPSFFDNDGLTVVEAACHKVPTLTLAETACCERITDGVDGFVADNDAQVFADKIVYLLRHKEALQQAGEAAQTRLPKPWKTTAQEYLSVYEACIAEMQRA